MCKCKQAMTYVFHIEEDDFASANGYDGDVPLPSNRSYSPYRVTLERRCIRCHEFDGNFFDSLGSIWATDDSEGYQFVVDAAFDALLPRNVSPADVDIDLI